MCPCTCHPVVIPGANHTGGTPGRAPDRATERLVSDHASAEAALFLVDSPRSALWLPCVSRPGPGRAGTPARTTRPSRTRLTDPTRPPGMSLRSRCPRPSPAAARPACWRHWLHRPPRRQPHLLGDGHRRKGWRHLGPRDAVVQGRTAPGTALDTGRSGWDTACAQRTSFQWHLSAPQVSRASRCPPRNQRR